VTFYFFDTSALVKRYHLEPGSERVNAIFDDQDNILIISELALVELASALQRKRNRGEITLQAMNDALVQFANEVLSDLIVTGFRSGFIQQAKDLVLQHSLRTLDALQLTSASEFRTLSPVLVCADARLRRAASDVGLVVLDPEVVP
jgi:predicted nucleic acid-binding protein